MTCISLITDGIDGITGPIRVAYLLGRFLIGLGVDVNVVSPYVREDVRRDFEYVGIKVRDLGIKPLLPGQAGHLSIWLINGVKGLINYGDDCLSINLSFELPIPSTVFYAQGYVGDLLRDLSQVFPIYYRLSYYIALPLINTADSTYHRALSFSKYVIANSRYSAEAVMSRGVRVWGVINPPVDTELFKPVPNPTQDYVLTYVGKETQFDVLKAMANAGIRIVAFGSKVPWMPRWFIKHQNIDYRGRVSDDELARLYANARFTVFPFIHEPFGYVPVESMACGTPVLTYDKQGPGETVINNETGWLVRGPEDLIRLAIKLWFNGYDESMRIKARERAMAFSVTKIINEWLGIINRSIHSRDEDKNNKELEY
ncbi:glycosyltransferase family 4 protein [Vulcanisaeta distributa]|uniref:Glycosyl transferase group 1 n=1 Tax=Vulcanisaeta distributa (strain DSM 14429 / JCM 11212 / NBRC 100878 / IC-017) TaxID=572478 RepID=E1QSB7_VULDI|nr:glycosyltransferase family 4 protein [Vulcanisaeta distributa]ADN49510.1 glycosyl transferase group 1 [Vulcanisaeta distributa DSM 14429]